MKHKVHENKIFEFFRKKKLQYSLLIFLPNYHLFFNDLGSGFADQKNLGLTRFLSENIKDSRVIKVFENSKYSALTKVGSSKVKNSLNWKEKEILDFLNSKKSEIQN